LCQHVLAQPRELPTNEASFQIGDEYAGTEALLKRTAGTTKELANDQVLNAVYMLPRTGNTWVRKVVTTGPG
jgi:hypothetical protein